MKKISILGDSISTFHGYIPEDYDLYYDVYAAMHNGIKGVEDIWWWKVIKLLNGELADETAFCISAFPIVSIAAYLVSYRISCKLWLKGAVNYE